MNTVDNGNEQDKVQYNYYRRNTDGSFVLDDIPVDTFPVPLFSYRALYKNAQLKQIVGFYYQTDVVKFIDEITDNHITKTSYFDYDTGEPFYTHETSYNQGLLLSILIKFSDNWFKNYETKIIFDSLPDADGFKYIETNTEEIRDEFIQDFINKRYPPTVGNFYSETNGIVTNNYKPIQLRQKAIRILGNQYMPLVSEETYDYSDNGILSRYTISINNKLSELMYTTTDNNIYSEIIQQFDTEGNANIIRKLEQIGDIYIETVEENNYNDTPNNKMLNKLRRVKYGNDLFLEYNYIDDNFLTEDSKFVLVGNDERITFDSNFRIINSSINFSLSIFAERIHMCRRVIKLYTADKHNDSEK